MTSLSASKPTKEVFMTIPQKECSFAGCEKPSHARTWCRGHYWQWSKGLDLYPIYVAKNGCLVESCEGKHAMRGYCAKHAIRFRTYGNAEEPLKVRFDGSSRIPEYKNWMAMKSRCYVKTAGNYRLYGARGIKVCDRWLEPLNGFHNFLEDMGSKPSPQHSLDRINVNGNYSPDNCRWATVSEQNRNKRPEGISGVKGIVPIKNMGSYRWRVNVLTPLKSVYIGMFKDLDEAIAAHHSASSYISTELAPEVLL